MAKQVRQFRYYGANHKNNYPVTNTSTNISSNSLVRGDLFDDSKKDSLLLVWWQTIKQAW